MRGKLFLGIGAGPIQTGIFVAGAAAGGFRRIVLADVDNALVTALRRHRSITVNTAGTDAVRTDRYAPVEIYNPDQAADLAVLIETASQADVINTALPATRFYRFCAPWLREGFERNPAARRQVYTSENSTTAAADLAEAIGKSFPSTYFLDTVIGKMSKVFDAEENGLPPLAPGFRRGHLVEEFNTIYTSDAPGAAECGIVGLHPRRNLLPFEEAKLYGHNASHLVLALLARQRGCRCMSEAARMPDLLETTRRVLVDECGQALQRKFAGCDPFFEPAEYTRWAEELIRRMVSPLLNDEVARVSRDLARKLGWQDRLIGAIRLCGSTGTPCPNLMRMAALAARFRALDELQAEWPPDGAELARQLCQEA